MKTSALLLSILLLVLSACGGNGDDNLNADGEPLGGDAIGVTLDEDDASAITPGEGSTSDTDIFGSDTENASQPTLNDDGEDGELFAEESGTGATGD